MQEQYDDALWQAAFPKPDWYLDVIPQFKRLEALALQEPDYDKRKAIKGPMYQAVATALDKGRIALASEGEDSDAARQAIDIIVIHHTKNRPGMSLELLNGEHLLRVYALYYAHPSPRNQHIKGQPIWSGHFYQGKQVFWAYHWLFRQDGRVQHILDDKYIGWHAGNYLVNCRSVALCIDDDLTSSLPSDKVLDALASVIQQYYPRVPLTGIVGHCDVNDQTVCPGDLFHSIWRNKLLARLE
jgi:N-acetylmuramoyl-L-alanine amidase